MVANYVHQSVRIAKYFILSAGLGFVTAYAKIQSAKGDGGSRQLIKRIDTLLPGQPPAINEESIRQAMLMYGIRLPRHVMFPTVDLTLEDRGVTSKESFSAIYKVQLGPAAFESWSILGSTLAHEIEVHCEQSFMLIGLMDTLGLDGTGTAERHAYSHEINNARRFGLSREDVHLIQGTVDLYYPLDDAPRLTGRIGSFLGATLRPLEGNAEQESRLAGSIPTGQRNNGPL